MRFAVDGGVRTCAAHPPNKIQAAAESVTIAAVRRFLRFFTWAAREDEISADLTPLDDLDQKHHKGEYKQDVDESSHRVGADESERPEDKKNAGDCIEHSGWGCGFLFW